MVRCPTLIEGSALGAIVAALYAMHCTFSHLLKLWSTREGRVTHNATLVAACMRIKRSERSGMAVITPH